MPFCDHGLIAAGHAVVLTAAVLLHPRAVRVLLAAGGLAPAVQPNGSTRLTGVFGVTRAARGDMVGLRMDPAGCHLFPAEP
jgi:hypothetical protein